MSKERRETQTGSGRSGIHAAERNVLDFLRKCKAYEADSVRVIVGIVESGADLKSADEADLKTVNKYLSDGYYKEDGEDTGKMIVHRTKRAQELLAKLSNFFDKDGNVKAANVVMECVTNMKAVERMRKELQARQTTAGINTQPLT